MGGHTALALSVYYLPVVGSKDGGLHLPLGNDVPDAGEPVSKQEEAPHEQDQDEAAVLRIPATVDTVRSFEFCLLQAHSILRQVNSEYINVDLFTHYSLSIPI